MNTNPTNMPPEASTVPDNGLLGVVLPRLVRRCDTCAHWRKNECLWHHSHLLPYWLSYDADEQSRPHFGADGSKCATWEAAPNVQVQGDPDSKP
jgi:hypothetical protein